MARPRALVGCIARLTPNLAEAESQRLRLWPPRTDKDVETVNQIVEAVGVLPKHLAMIGEVSFDYADN